MKRQSHLPIRDVVSKDGNRMSVELGNTIRMVIHELIAEAVRGRDSVPKPTENDSGYSKLYKEGQRRYFQNAVSFLTGWVGRFGEGGRTANAILVELDRNPWDRYTPPMTPLPETDDGNDQAESEASGRPQRETVVPEHPQSEISPILKGNGTETTGSVDCGNSGSCGGLDGARMGKPSGSDVERGSVVDPQSQKGRKRKKET